jgi:hypothetical protein
MSLNSPNRVAGTITLPAPMPPCLRVCIRLFGLFALAGGALSVNACLGKQGEGVRRENELVLGDGQGLAGFHNFKRQRNQVREVSNDWDAP